MAKILLVDDDEIMVAALAGLLEAEKHRVECISDGLEALEHLKSFDYDVVVLDWQLPSMEGIDVCQKYRASGGKNFIIMLTGQSDTEHKEKGLDTGADDYLTKPFDTRELLARIRVCLRRPSEFHGEVLKFGPLECDLKARSLSINSTEIKLSPLEFSVLEFFLRHPNEVYSCESLLNKVWTSEDEVSLDAVYTCMTRLRKKIQVKDRAQYIQNIHGVGYKFVPPTD